jgi:hypothetical protein
MNEKYPMEDAIDEMAERLIKLGFATRYLVNETTGVTSLAWTESGTAFRDDMRRIFNSTTSINDVSNFEIGAMLVIMLFSPNI